jgi:aryl-alcohol dehydrogenase-like predicted oxidoreductase
MNKRTIPSSGEQLSIIGMGTSRTFSHDVSKRQLGEVMQAFFDHGGQLIDSSPMYGPAESLVGDLLKTTKNTEGLFVATKVWTYGKESGIEQMQQSMQRMGVEVIDLMQIHNLRHWEAHIHTLREWKAQGKIRYLGITTSHGSRHEEFEEVMKAGPLDFVQFSYNLVNRVAEERLFPIAADKGIATLINRPFQRGRMFRTVRGKKLPKWAGEFDCKSWAQFFLKFVVSHPNVTNVIPATSKPHHMVDNMGAGYGRLPDARTRERMIKYFESL